MTFLELAGSRYSYRGYTDKPIEKDILDYILKCANLAPSATNRQPWQIYIVSDKKTKEALYQAYPREWFLEAPYMVAFVGLHKENWIRKDGRNYLLSDITIVADYFILAAAEKGLGTCYIAAFDEDLVKRALNLSDNEIPLLLTPLGYPKKDAKRERNRKDINDITVFR